MSLKDFYIWMFKLWGIRVDLGMLELLERVVRGGSKYRKDCRPKGRICV